MNRKHSFEQLEIDFIVNKASSRVYIQSALTIFDESKMNQELASFRAIYWFECSIRPSNKGWVEIAFLTISITISAEGGGACIADDLPGAKVFYRGDVRVSLSYLILAAITTASPSTVLILYFPTDAGTMNVSA